MVLAGRATGSAWEPAFDDLARLAIRPQLLLARLQVCLQVTAATVLLSGDWLRAYFHVTAAVKMQQTIYDRLFW